MGIQLGTALQIPGWMSLSELQWLAETAKKSEKILEFGSYLGRSTRALADNTNGIIYAVDPWDGIYYNNDGTIAHWINTKVLEIFKNNLGPHIESGRVIPVKEFSWAFSSSEKFDLVFIDGDHRYDAVRDDIYTGLRFVKSGGILAGHDYSEASWPGVKKAVDEVLGEVNHTDSIWWTVIK